MNNPHITLIKKIISKEKIGSKILFVYPASDMVLEDITTSHQIDVMHKNIEILNYYAKQDAKNIFSNINSGILPVKTEEYSLVVIFPSIIESVKSQLAVISEINRISKKSLIFFQNGGTIKRRLRFLLTGNADERLQQTLESKKYFSYQQIQYLTYKSGFSYEICFAKVDRVFVNSKKISTLFTLTSDEFAFFRDSENAVKIKSEKSLLNVAQP